MQKLIAAGFAVAAALILPTGCAAPSGTHDQTAEGYGPWKLGMTLTEAQSAEPRAEPWQSDTCAPNACLSYFDRRFHAVAKQVTGDFGDNDILKQILVVMVIGGQSRCEKAGEDLLTGYTNAHGAPETSNPSSGYSFWDEGNAHYSLAVNCDGGVIIVVVSRPARADIGI